MEIPVLAYFVLKRVHKERVIRLFHKAHRYISKKPASPKLTTIKTSIVKRYLLRFGENNARILLALEIPGNWAH